MLNNTVPQGPTHAEKTQLVNLGMMMGGLAFPHMNMTGAVHAVLNTPPVLANLTVALNQTVPNLEEALHGLAAWLDTVPHDNLKASLTASMTVMVSVAIIAVILRIYSRMKVTGKLWAEDWWAVAAMVSVFAAYVSYMFCTHTGSKHMWDLTYHEVWMTCVQSTILAFTVALVAVKFTFAVFYYRLSPDKLYRRAIMALMAVISLQSFIGLFIEIFMCKQVDYWNHILDPDLKCINRPAFFAATGYITIGTDVLLLLLPMWKVSKLNLRRRRDKLMVLGMFAAGGLINIANVFRVIFFNRTYVHYAASYVATAAGNWGLLELNLAIVISCLPAIKHLLMGQNKSGSVSNLASKILRTVQRRRTPPGEPTDLFSDNKDDASKVTSGCYTNTATKATKSVVGKDEEEGVVVSYMQGKDDVGVSEKVRNGEY